jgi:hypothetical protein
MDEKLLQDVLQYLTPQMRFLMSLVVGQNLTEIGLVKERIKHGLKDGKEVVFYPEEPSLTLELEKLKKEKGAKWYSLLVKQLNVIVDIIEKFEKQF